MKVLERTGAKGMPVFLRLSDLTVVAKREEGPSKEAVTVCTHVYVFLARRVAVVVHRGLID